MLRLVNFPVAVNCWSVNLAIFAVVGVNVKDVSDAGEMVSTVEALWEPSEAEICVVP